MWARIDDQFYLNKKTARIDRDEQDLFLAGNTYCNQQKTDGFIPGSLLTMLCAWAKIPTEANEAKVEAIASRLVQHEFWEIAEGGYQVHDFLDWNISKEESENLSDVRSEAGRLGGQRSAVTRRAIAEANEAKGQAKGQAKPKQNRTPNPILLTTIKENQKDIETYVSAGLTDYSNNIALIGSDKQSLEIMDRLEELFNGHLFDWWSLGIQAAIDKNARNWSYLRATIDNCLRQGTPPGSPKPQQSSRNYAPNGNGRTPSSSFSEGYTASGYEPEPAPLAVPPSEAEQLWQQTLAILRMQKIGGETFAGSHALNLSGDDLTIQVADQFKRELIEHRFLPKVCTAVEKAAGRPLTVRIETAI